MKDLQSLDSVSYKRSLLIGTLLGDASSRKKTKTKVECAVVHSLKLADFAEWKAGELSRLYGKKLIVRYDYEKKRVSFSLYQGRRIRVIHEWFHRNSKKAVTDKIRFMDHPVGLTMLLCDDGSVRKRKKYHKDGTVYYLKPNITMATHGYDLKSVDNLLCHIERLCGARGYLNPERRWRVGELKEYNRVNFNSENSQKLWEYIRLWIPRVPSMISKFAFAIEQFGIDE